MEIYKDIKGYEGLYQVSNLGNVKSLKRYQQNHSKLQLVPEKIRKISDNGKGYKNVTLHKNGKSKILYIHRLVGFAFLDNPKTQINHKDGNRGNNKLENLEWCTVSENAKHKINVLGYKHPKGGNCKLSVKINQYTLDGEFIKQHGGIREAERSLGQTKATNIYRVCKGQYKQCLGYIWQYAK